MNNPDTIADSEPLVTISDSEPQTTGSSQSWKPSWQMSLSLDLDATTRECSEATPPNVVLLKWAKTARTPPQSWFDDETDPFKPAE